MKYLSRLLLLGILFTSSVQMVKSQVVAEIIDKKPVFTVDETELLDTYNENMKQLSDLDVIYKDVDILHIGNDYYLIFTDSLGTTRSALPIVLSGEADNMCEVQGITSCTTSNYSSSSKGCLPRAILHGCSSSDNKGKCTETKSASSLIE